VTQYPSQVQELKDLKIQTSVSSGFEVDSTAMVISTVKRLKQNCIHAKYSYNGHIAKCEDEVGTEEAAIFMLHILVCSEICRQAGAASLHGVGTACLLFAKKVKLSLCVTN
jgi:hypothetical protein